MLIMGEILTLGDRVQGMSSFKQVDQQLGVLSTSQR
jgi:hypothetical protein